MVELNAGLYLWNFREEYSVRLEALAKATNDVDVICRHYAVPDDLADELRLLLEVRHEIVHPASRPGPEACHTPAYLHVLRERNLLMSTGQEADYVWISQLQSHRLFRWAFETVARTAELLLVAHGIPEAHIPLLQSYRKYLEIDAA